MVVGSLDQPGLGEIDPAKRRQLRVLSQTNPRKLLIYGLVCESTLNFGRISGGWIDFGHRWLVLVRPVTSVCRASVAGLSKVETFQLRWLQLGPARRAPCPPRSPGGWRERRHSCPLGWLPRPTWANKNHHADKSAPPATKIRHFQGNVRAPSDVPVAGGASHDPVFDGLLLTFSIVWAIFTR